MVRFHNTIPKRDYRKVESPPLELLYLILTIPYRFTTSVVLYGSRNRTGPRPPWGRRPYLVLKLGEDISPVPEWVYHLHDSALSCEMYRYSGLG
jgi:hypothetical protein